MGTNTACCDMDITGKCSGNTASSTDVTCGTNKILKYNAAAIAGTDEAACCDTACSAHTCSTGKHSKINAASIRGATDALCCDLDITGKCSGNTVSSTDVTCGTNKILKSNAAAIAGTNEAACCDTTCSAHSCSPGKHPKSNAASIIG